LAARSRLEARRRQPGYGRDPPVARRFCAAAFSAL